MDTFGTKSKSSNDGRRGRSGSGKTGQEHSRDGLRPGGTTEVRVLPRRPQPRRPSGKMKFHGPADVIPEPSGTLWENYDDPLAFEADLFDETDGLFYSRYGMRFVNDYSMFPHLVRVSYLEQRMFDRNFRESVSFGMYQYYMTVLFWKRLYSVAENAEVSLQMSTALSFDTPFPEDIGYYLAGIGDITHVNYGSFKLDILCPPTDLEVEGIKGTFGKISAETAIYYETQPSPFVALWKIRADMAITKNPAAPSKWDLPAGVRPEAASATHPNTNLLGWFPAERLAPSQYSKLQACLGEQVPACRHVGNIPVNTELMAWVAGFLTITNCPTSTLSTDRKGSLAQIPYVERFLNTDRSGARVAAVLKADMMRSFRALPGVLASAASIMRYRFKRGVKDKDTLCYDFSEDAPEDWLSNENKAFTYGNGEELNTSNFSSSISPGDSLLRGFACKIRRRAGH